jgi:hypothetical protein
MQPAEPQGELPLTRAPRAQPVADEVIRACKTFLDALNLQMNISGLEDKELYIPLGIEASHWSRIRKGEFHFPLNKLEQCCDLCGNEVALTWWAWKRGKGLHMLETETQRLLRLANEALDEERKKSAVLLAALQGRAV